MFHGRLTVAICLSGCISRRLHAVFRLYCLYFICPLPLSGSNELQDDEHGLNVCLSCFNGGCAGSRDHARLHFERFGHPLALNIRRTRKKIQVSTFAFLLPFYPIQCGILTDKSEMSLHKRFPNLQSMRKQTRIAMIHARISSAILVDNIMLTFRPTRSNWSLET